MTGDKNSDLDEVTKQLVLAFVEDDNSSDDSQ
jgi:hypothetical protein